MLDRLIKQEMDRRLGIWNTLRKASPNGDARSLTAGIVNESRAFFGGRGIWRDKEVTADLSSDGNGITVGVLHTGSHYADDINDEGGIYHYPRTQNAGTDKGDIEATKNCHRYELPLFIVIRPTPKSRFRNVHFGWVTRWDDVEGCFLVDCGVSKKPPVVTENFDDVPFQLQEPGKKKKATIETRGGQPKFKFLVRQRYGAQCAYILHA